MSKIKRFIYTIIFLVISISLLELCDIGIHAYKQYQFYGRVPPSYRKDEKINEAIEIKKFFLKKEIVQELYKFVADIDAILTKNDIKYFLHAGTLLGAIRNNGHIPFDDDIDIAIFNEDADRFLKLEKDLNKLGYKLDKTRSDWYVIRGKNLAMDVFHIKKYGSIYRYANEQARLAWPLEYFYEDELLPLKKHRFGGINLFVPKNPEAYLRRFYGQDCLDYAVFSGNHRFGSIGRTFKVKINEIIE